MRIVDLSREIYEGMPVYAGHLETKVWQHHRFKMVAHSPLDIPCARPGRYSRQYVLRTSRFHRSRSCAGSALALGMAGVLLDHRGDARMMARLL